jgi:hypothetical protein
MSFIDDLCDELIEDAGLTGGRGQASGFIMRMMAENKKKHQGQYKNPSDNNYGSTMNSFRSFDYRKLANRDQNGRNQSDYGASPFIIKHFGSPEAVRFVPKSERTREEHVEGETEEQKAARLNAKAVELAQLAKDLLAKSEAKNKVKGFLKGKVLVKRAKEVLGQKKIESEEKKERERKAREPEEIKKANRQKAEEFEKELEIKDNELLLPILKEALRTKKVVVLGPKHFYDDRLQLKEHQKLGTHREKAELRFDKGYVRGYTARQNYPRKYVEFTFPEYREALKKLRADAISLKKAGEESKIGYKGKYKHDSLTHGYGKETAWERKGSDLTDRLSELGLTTERRIGYSGTTDTEPRPNAGYTTKPPEKPLWDMTAKDKEYYNKKMSDFYDNEDVPRMTKFLATLDKAIVADSSDAKLTERTEAQIAKVEADLSRLRRD